MKEVIITVSVANYLPYLSFYSQGLYAVRINIILILQMSKLCQRLLIVSHYLFSPYSSSFSWELDRLR